MFIERRINGGRIERWECDWTYPNGAAAHKTMIRLIGVEQPLAPNAAAGHATAEAICWAYGRTLGDIAVFTQEVLGSFLNQEGSDASLAGDFVDAGKFRHGKDRWWCRTHQTHWGTNADMEAAKQSGFMFWRSTGGDSYFSCAKV
jgi:hypothetical protein